MFGKRRRVEDVVLGNVSSLSLKVEGGGGFIVSGIEDVNHDGYDDVMITSCLNYVSKSNAYMVRYPLSMTSAPSVYPSSPPSSFPSSVPSQQPSSSHSSMEAPSSGPSNVPSLVGSARPEQPFVPSPTMLPTRRPSFFPSYRPTVKPKTNAPVLESRTPTPSPFFSPSYIPTKIKVGRPLTSCPSSMRPSRAPTALYSPNPTDIFQNPSRSSKFRVRSVNGSSVDREGIVYGVEGEREIFQISSVSGDGKRSGWSGTVIGGGGRKVYVIYPKDASQPVNRIVLKDFDSCCDVLDLSHFSAMSSQSDLSYLTHPLTIFLPDNQKIVLPTYLVMSSLSDRNFIFLEDPSPSSSSDSVKDGLVDTLLSFSVLLPVSILLGLSFLFAFAPYFTWCKKGSDLMDDMILKRLSLDDNHSHNEFAFVRENLNVMNEFLLPAVRFDGAEETIHKDGFVNEIDDLQSISISNDGCKDHSFNVSPICPSDQEAMFMNTIIKKDESSVLYSLHSSHYEISEEVDDDDYDEIESVEFSLSSSGNDSTFSSLS